MFLIKINNLKIKLMAVKPEQIKARLKVLFPKANLSAKRMDALVAKLCLKPADDADDTAIDVVLNDANDFISFEDIAKEDDRIRTLEANQKPKEVQTPAEIEAARVEAERLKNHGTPQPDDTPAWAKALIDSNKKLNDDLEAMKTGKITESKKQTAQSLLDKSEVLKGMKPEIKAGWVARIDVNSETSIEDQISALETEYTDITQGLADNSQYSGAAPRGGADAKPSDKAIEAIVDSL